jgi:nucleotide-binding universal stress UspA family protein
MNIASRSQVGYRTITVYLDGREESRARLNYAIGIAARAGRSAHITAIFAEFPIPQSIGYARGAGMTDATTRIGSEVRDAVEWGRARLEAAARETGVGVEWRTIAREASLHELALAAAYGDLTVLPPHDSLWERYGWSPVGIVMSSGVPAIVVPAARTVPREPSRIVVAWNASRVARRAISDSIPLLRAAESVVVAVIDPSIGHAAHGEDPGSDIARFLARHDLNVDVVRRDAQGVDISDVLLAIAAERDADLLVAGVYGHSRVTELLLGSTTRALLSRIRIPLFVSH